MLLGCGRQALPTTPIGFVNATKHSDAKLWAIWGQAQKSVANSIDLNPLQAGDGAAQVLPGELRALGVLPDPVGVAAAPAGAGSVLAALTGIPRSQPTGLIACPAPCR